MKTRLLLFFLFFLVACERPDPQVTILVTPAATGFALAPTPFLTPLTGNNSIPTPVLTPFINPALPTYVGVPTPDAPHSAVSATDTTLTHLVNPGETLNQLAQQYGTTVENLAQLNQLQQTDLLFVGQQLIVPGQASLVGPAFKIIPDSELVYGPAAKGFDVRSFANPYNGQLLLYSEEVEGQLLAGPEIVSLVAHRYSVNPRLLLAVLEYRAGWVTKTAVSGALDTPSPLGINQPGITGLYLQLGWVANELNWGYYGRSEGGLTTVTVTDGTRAAFAPEINNGTAGVQRLLAAFGDATYDRWLQDTGANGLFLTYSQLFGNPFAYTVDPLWPASLAQPPLQLPWTSKETWFFTGGPHGGWATGSAWAALDFVPPGEQLGCVQSDNWITAMADGLVTRGDFGAVVVDLDGDGFAGTGWAITYMHLESRDRVPVGTWVQTGDRLGHPSCEGGYSNGTHVHISRTYNGRWVAADGTIPFNMGGWLSQGLGREYDGLLVRGDVVREACECREELNAISGE